MWYLQTPWRRMWLWLQAFKWMCGICRQTTKKDVALATNRAFMLMVGICGQTMKKVLVLATGSWSWSVDLKLNCRVLYRYQGVRRKPSWTREAGWEDGGREEEGDRAGEVLASGQGELHGLHWVDLSPAVCWARGQGGRVWQWPFFPPSCASCVEQGFLFYFILCCCGFITVSAYDLWSRLKSWWSSLVLLKKKNHLKQNDC